MWEYQTKIIQTYSGQKELFREPEDENILHET